MAIITQNSQSPASKIVSLLFNARTNAHFFHLETKSFAQHKALDDFYSGVVDLGDRFAESYQGQYGLISGYTIGNKESEPLAMLVDQLKQVVNLKSSFKDSHLVQILDDVVELYTSTIYKLRFLS